MRAKEFILSVSPITLLEIKMSPSSLRKLSDKIDAKVGMEFEMSFPNIYLGDEDYDQEPDFDYDESVHSISDVIRFFENGQEISDYQLSRLEDSLIDKVTTKKFEIIQERWDEDGKEFFSNWVKENVPESDVAEFHEKDPDKQTPTSSDWEEFIKYHFEEETPLFYEAKEEFEREHNDFDEEDILNHLGYRYMEDIYQEFDVPWPYINNISENNEEVLSELAYSLQEKIGVDVDYSTEYHGTHKSLENYTIEPDSSIMGDGAGLEIVSPPRSLSEILEDIKIIKEWAKEHDAQTNSSTGLHMNISVPGYSENDLDFVKLVLLVGDKYVLDTFGRAANRYAKSALDLLQNDTTDDDKEIFFRNLKGKLGKLASKVIHSGSVDKYTSINPQGNRVEFRSPGGDWLNTDTNILEQTLRRFIVALDAAVDPEKYKKEYLKKLTKMFAPKRGSIEEIFVQYASGNLDKEELKARIANTRQQRKMNKFKDKGIIVTDYNSVKSGDWYVEQENPNTLTSRVMLKATNEVNTGDKALKAALEVMPDRFDLSRIEDITATKIKSRKYYVIHEKGLIYNSDFVQRGYTKLEAIDSAMSNHDFLKLLDIDATEYNQAKNYNNLNNVLIRPNKPVFIVINQGYYSGVMILSGDNQNHAMARAMLYNRSFAYNLEDVLVVSIKDAMKNDGIHENLQMYMVINLKNSRYNLIAACSKQEAKFIATSVYPGDYQGTPVAVMIKENASNIAKTYENMFWEMQSKGIVNKYSKFQIYRVREKNSNLPGGYTVPATSPEDAIKKIKQQFTYLQNADLEAEIALEKTY